MQYNMLYINIYTWYIACAISHAIYHLQNVTYHIHDVHSCAVILLLLQGHGRKTWAGRSQSSKTHEYKGKHVLDIHLLKAERHEAVPVAGPQLLVCDNAAAPEWVTYQYRTAHPILRWLPTKLAEWLAENMSAELVIPAKTAAQWTVGELNNILANNLVPNQYGGHLRTFTTLQWECEHYRGRPKEQCYPFNLPGHRFQGRNLQVYLIYIAWSVPLDISWYISWYFTWYIAWYIA